MTVPINKLPDSKSEVWSLVLVGLLSALAAIGRMLYGKDDISRRRFIGSIIVALTVSLAVYSLLVYNAELPLPGYFGVAIGVISGLFTDDILKRAPALLERFGAGKGKDANDN